MLYGFIICPMLLQMADISRISISKMLTKSLLFIWTICTFGILFGVSAGLTVMGTLCFVAIYFLTGRGEYTANYYEEPVKNAWTVISPLPISNLFTRAGIGRTQTRQWLLVELGESEHSMMI